MARLNQVTLMGKVVSEEIEPKIIEKTKTNGEEASVLLNFKIQCWDQEDGRYYTLPVAVWGLDMVDQCEKHIKYGDVICVIGELRYKFIKDGKGKNQKIYTAVKAESVEFISKKVKNEPFYHPINQIRLIGNLVHDPIQSDEGFVIAVDRLAPSKEKSEPDYVTLVLKDKSLIRGELKKGSMAIIDGKVMTVRKKEGVVHPRIVVGVKEMVGR